MSTKQIGQIPAARITVQCKTVALPLNHICQHAVVPLYQTRQQLARGPICTQVQTRPYGSGPDQALSQRLAQAETAAAEAHRALHAANSAAADAARYAVHQCTAPCQPVQPLAGSALTGHQPSM